MPTLLTSYGSNNANAYISLADAETLLADTLLSVKWAAIIDSTKEILILTATRHLDAKNWVGSRYFTDQTLSFPRTTTYPRYRSSTDPLTPGNVDWRDQEKFIRLATAIQAVWENERASGSFVDYRLIQSQGVRSLSQGGGNINSSVSFGNFASVIHPDAMSLLQPWKGSPRVRRG